MDLVTPEFGLFFWTILVMLTIALPVLALISVLRNNFRANDKLIWVLAVVFIPLIGSILYYIIGRPRQKAYQIRNSNQNYFKY